MIVKTDLPKLKFLNRFKKPILSGQKTMTIRKNLEHEWQFGKHLATDPDGTPFAIIDIMQIGLIPNLDKHAQINYWCAGFESESDYLEFLDKYLRSKKAAVELRFTLVEATDEV